MDAEHPVCTGGARNGGFDLRGACALAVFGIACIVFLFSVPGRAFPGRIVVFQSRTLR